MVRLFGRYKNWGNIPKFFNMRKYTWCIRQWGMTDLTTTGPKESFVKTVRKAWEFTNKHPDTVDKQANEAAWGMEGAKYLQQCLTEQLVAAWGVSAQDLDHAK
ncbi:hypothetical protein VOLCADRAFT_101276, partial [Volvox carteri f. nagariensis]